MAGASKFCYCCGSLTGFYIWSTSRHFPRDKLIDNMNIDSNKLKRKEICANGVSVCFSCYNDLIKA